MKYPHQVVEELEPLVKEYFESNPPKDGFSMEGLSAAVSLMRIASALEFIGFELQLKREMG